MSHNPVISSSKQTKSRLAQWLTPANPQIAEGTMGLLYLNGKFLRTLNPGEQDNTPNATLYVVTMRPHRLPFTLELPSATTPYRFPIRVTIEYQIENPRWMIDNTVTDTEELVIKLIEPVLQRQSREIQIEKYKSLLSMLENTISQKLLSSVGLSLNSSIINVEHNEYWQNVILPLLKLRQASHVELVPTSDRNYSFNVMADVSYSISDTASLNESPEVAEKVLWQQIAQKIRRMCSEYSFRQAREADQNIQNEISKQNHTGFGIVIESINISIDIDQKAQDILNFEHQKEFEKLKNEIDEIRRNHQGQAADFYKQFVDINDPVRKSLMAYILSKNPEDARSILSYVDEREKVIVERQLALLQTFVDKGDIWDEKTQGVIQSILDALKGAPIGLPGSVSTTPQLEDKAKAHTKIDEDVIVIREEDIEAKPEDKSVDGSDETTFKPFDAD